MRAFPAAAILLSAIPLIADPVAVLHREGIVRGFLAMRDVDNNLIASGDLNQTSVGNRVTSQLIFHFKDGSVRNETSIYTDQKVFRLLSYRLVQKGASFKTPMDLSLNAVTGQVTIRYTDDGKEKTVNEQIKVPPDLANGLITTLLKNIDPKTPKTTVSMLVATPKPRIVKLEVTPAGEDPFSAAGAPRKAQRFVVHVSIGGIAGVVAPIVGKQPPDTSVWIIEGKAPGFLKSRGPLSDDGPVWQIELASPVWPKPGPAIEAEGKR